MSIRRVLVLALLAVLVFATSGLASSVHDVDADEESMMFLQIEESVNAESAAEIAHAERNALEEQLADAEEAAEWASMNEEEVALLEESATPAAITDSQNKLAAAATAASDAQQKLQSIEVNLAEKRAAAQKFATEAETRAVTAKKELRHVEKRAEAKIARLRKELGQNNKQSTRISTSL